MEPCYIPHPGNAFPVRRTQEQSRPHLVASQNLPGNLVTVISPFCATLINELIDFATGCAYVCRHHIKEAFSFVEEATLIVYTMLHR
jgi:hypothetical protein